MPTSRIPVGAGFCGFSRSFPRTGRSPGVPWVWVWLDTLVSPVRVHQPPTQSTARHAALEGAAVLSPVARSRRRLRPRASSLLSIILFAVLAFLSSQLVISGAGATSPHPSPAMSSEAASDPDGDHRASDRPRSTAPRSSYATSGHHDDDQHARRRPPRASGRTTPAGRLPGRGSGPGPQRLTGGSSRAPAGRPGCGAARRPGNRLGLQRRSGLSAGLCRQGVRPGVSRLCRRAPSHDLSERGGGLPGSAVIAIADACPQAYMNEASNSYVVTGTSDAAIDPYGSCP